MTTSNFIECSNGWSPMRFDIKANCRRGLRVIRSIPDYRLARIEGYNGLGKSAAIRLLQLCVGDQPYMGQPGLWSSFRDHLVEARVEVTSLVGAQSIVWNIPSTVSWPAEPQALGNAVGRIEIDGKIATLSDVAQLLAIHRIDGKEGFKDTVVHQAADIAQALDRRFGSKGQLESRRRLLDETLSETEFALPKLTVAQLVAARRAVRESELLRNRFGEQLHRINERVEVLVRAAEISRKLEDVRDRGPDLAQRIADLDRQIARVKEGLAILDRQVEESSAREERDRAANKEFALAQRHLARCKELHDKSRTALRATAGRARVLPESAAVRQALEERTKELEALSRKVSEAHSAPLVAQLLTRLSTLLGQAEGEGLGGQSVTLQDKEWTVRSLREAFERAAEIRRAEPVPETAEQQTSRIHELREQIRQTTAAQSALQDVHNARQRLSAAEQRLSSASGALPPDTARTVSELLDRRRGLEQESRALEDRRHHAAQALEALTDGLTEGELAAELTSVCRSIGVAPSRIQGQLISAQEESSNIQRSLVAASARADQAIAGNAHQLESIREAIELIHHHPNLGWLRRAIGASLPGSDVEAEHLLVFVTRLAQAIETIRERLGNTAQDLLGISGAMSDLVQELQGRATTPSDWTVASRKWLEGQVNNWLNLDGVRDALFPDGIDIGVDLLTDMVLWTDKRGNERQSRPLEGFSSGQQAVAYTQARLSLLNRGSTEVANRLIVLDEFGSFVDAKSMANLQSALASRQRRFVADQIVLILPLSAEKYRLEGNSSDAQRRDLEELGYLVEEIPVVP